MIVYKIKYLKYRMKYLQLKRENIKKKKEQESQDNVIIEKKQDIKIKQITKLIIKKTKYFKIIDSVLCKENTIKELMSKITDNNRLILKRILKTIYTELMDMTKIFPDFERCSSKILLELFSNRITNAMKQLTEWKNNTINKLDEINKEINFNTADINEFSSFTELKDNLKLHFNI